MIRKTTMMIIAALSTTMSMAQNNNQPAELMNYNDTTFTLDEVTVKSTQPKTRLKGNAMVTTIKGSALEKSGTARDMLAKVPGMIERDGSLQVIGKGTPIYYINGRRMQDGDELKRLRSEEIQSVEVITNPGAQYDATVSSVVRIKTIRRQGDGFGFDLMAANNQDLRYGYSDPSGTLNLRYRHNSLDVFGMANYWKWDAVNDSNPYQSSWIMQNGSIMNTIQDTDLRHDHNMQGMNFNLGFNYQISQNHSLGMRIENHQKFNSGVQAWIGTEMIQRYMGTDTRTESGSLQDAATRQPYSFDGNAYYNGKFGKLGVDLNVDFVKFKNEEENTITEFATRNRTGNPSSVMGQTQNSKSDLLASKLVFSYPIWRGQLNAGTEMSFVTRSNNYTISGYPLPATSSEVNEKNVAGFVEYGCDVPKIGNLNAGLRFEHVGFDYTDNIDGQKSMSRYTDDIFPSFSWARQWGVIQTSLAYSIKTVRPDYSMLDESIIYINSYSLQKGNPQLKNAIMNEVSANVRYRWLNLFMAYERRDHTHTMWSYIYNNDGVILVQNINLEKPVRNFAAFITASPTIGVYSANWTAGWQKYFFKQTLADPREATGQREVSYSKPIMFFDLNNTFRLKHRWQFEANMNITGKGDVMNYRLTAPSYNLRLVMQKCWLKDDALCLRVTAGDVLQKTGTKMEMDCGYYVLNQHSKSNQHRLDISLRYTFNASNNKYKGTGAGKEAKNRLGE